MFVNIICFIIIKIEMKYNISAVFNNKQSESESTSVVLTVERANIKFTRIIYQILNMIKVVTLIYSLTLAVLNRHRVIDKLSQYERKMVNTLGTILQRDIEHTQHFKQYHPSTFELTGMLSYDQLIFVLCLTFMAVLCQKFVGSKIVREKLIIIKGLGIQLESEALQGTVVSRRFVDINRVRDIVINEYLTMFDIGQYLAVIVEKEQKLLLPFANSKLTFKELIPLYRAAKKVLGPSFGSTFQECNK